MFNWQYCRYRRWKFPLAAALHSACTSKLQNGAAAAPSRAPAAQIGAPARRLRNFGMNLAG
jgi:hypothetical protein